jgi:uncharacterized protein (TIGR02453 family)
MARFEGFGKQALPFFKALAFHQTRDWFEANRALYESDVRQPAIALIEDLAGRFAAAGKKAVPLTGDGRRSLFRLNRDVRFSRDKSPYKTHLGAVLTRSGGKNDPGLLYIHISPEGCWFGGGFYHLEPDKLLLMRKAIAKAGKGFTAVEAALRKGGLELGDDEQMTRLPRGFEEHKGGPLDGALRMRNFVVREAVADKDIFRPVLAERAFDFANRSEALLRFGWKALG